jgi:hypothetical protein
VEAVAQENEGDGDDVVPDELFEVLPRLLLAEEHDDGLLHPVGGLEQVVELENAVVGQVRVRFVHCARLEIP